jgi:hypothetical protein
MHTFLPRFPQLLSPFASGGLQQNHVRGTRVSRQRWHRWPGFRHQAARRQRLLAQQRDQPPHPALAKHAHEPQAGRPPRPRALWAPTRSIGKSNGFFHRPRPPTLARTPPGRARGAPHHRAPPPRRRARTGRVAGDGKPARLGRLEGTDSKAMRAVKEAMRA